MNGSDAIAYGLDLAGFSIGKSALVKAARKEEKITINIITGHAFENKLTGVCDWAEQVHKERECIKKIVGSGDCGIYIDVPIDLQNLLKVNDCDFVWELTKRPVDYALKGLAPLANLIGVPVARMQSILANQSLSCMIGEQIFETYPNASLREIIEANGRNFKYKSTSAVYNGEKWEAKKGGSGVVDLLNKTCATASKGVEINDDHFDAIVCAVTGLCDKEDLWDDDDLSAHIEERCKKNKPLPKGYKIIRSWPYNLRIEIEAHKPWSDFQGAFY